MPPVRTCRPDDRVLEFHLRSHAPALVGYLDTLFDSPLPVAPLRIIVFADSSIPCGLELRANPVPAGLCIGARAFLRAARCVGKVDNRVAGFIRRASADGLPALPTNRISGLQPRDKIWRENCIELTRAVGAATSLLSSND